LNSPLERNRSAFPGDFAFRHLATSQHVRTLPGFRAPLFAPFSKTRGGQALKRDRGAVSVLDLSDDP
jgi:hypothetical protein